ncbi:hypothetical protein [Streptomyces sp. NPDC001312]|uniref:hypothetical protein n=1 Tax=Streptomyces sp. NPDC001312 TaxID=3364561 RepID=UPI003676F423
MRASLRGRGDVQRTDRLGSSSLSCDLPPTKKSVTYTASYTGDAVHAGSTALATVNVKK